MVRRDKGVDMWLVELKSGRYSLSIDRIQSLDPKPYDYEAEGMLASVMPFATSVATENKLAVSEWVDFFTDYLQSVPGLGAQYWRLEGGPWTQSEWDRRYALILSTAALKGLDVERMHRSAVAYFFGRGYQPACLRSAVQARFRKGLKVTKVCVRENVVRRFLSRHFPTPVEWYGFMLARARVFFGQILPSSVGQALSEARVCLLSLLINCLQYVSLLRLGHYAKTEADAWPGDRATNPHTLTTADAFVVCNPDVGRGVHLIDRRKSLDKVVTIFEWHGPEKEVAALLMIPWTQKNQAFHAEPHVLQRSRSDAEDELLEMLLLSRSFCTRGPTDQLFSVVSETVPTGRRVLARNVNDMLKAVAGHFGLDPKEWSSTCNRVAGMTTACRVAGATETSVIAVTRHARFSTVRRHYRFPFAREPRSEERAASRMIAGATDDCGFRMDDIYLQLRLRVEVRANQLKGLYSADRSKAVRATREGAGRSSKK